MISVLSVVKLLGLGEDGKQVVLEIEGGDFLNGTPVYDIKPYVPYADRIEDATSAWAQTGRVAYGSELR